MKLSIIIPVFNEEKTVLDVFRRLKAVDIADVEKEVIAVDDGSIDTTPQKILQAKKEIPNLKTISHKHNLGKGAAVRTGIKYATGDYILIQDADLEYNPKYISKLMVPVQRYQAEAVYGTRLKRPPHLFKEEKSLRFLLHYLGNRALSLLTSILYGQWITDMETGYKIFSRKAVETINLRAKSFDFEPEITAKLLKTGHHIVEIPITTNPRGYEEGKKLNTLKDGIIALWTLLKYRFVN